MQIQCKLLLGDQKAVALLPGTVEQVLIRMCTQVMSVSYEPLYNSMKFGILVKLTGEEKGSLQIMSGQHICNIYSAIGIFIPCEYQGQFGFGGITPDNGTMEG